MRIIEKTIYKFSELPPEVQTRVIGYFRSNQWRDDPDHVWSDVSIAEHLASQEIEYDLDGEPYRPGRHEKERA